MDMEGKFSPMETGKKDEAGNPIMDMTTAEAKVATTKSAFEKAEEAKKSLEAEISEKKTPEQIKAEISDVLKSLENL